MSIASIKAQLAQYGLTPNKALGQNFLADDGAAEEIAASCMGPVIEIGPGIGVLTKEAARVAKKVVAIELDKRLIPILSETLSGCDNVEVINADAMKLDLKALIAERFGARKVAVCANLPYYITSPIIMGLLEGKAPIESITIMVQKEVAERMQTGPGSKDYGALSLAVQYYADANILMTVPASCFMPRPKVDSSVIKLDIYDKPPVDVCDEEMMFKIIRASFNQRRKTLVNGLKNASNLPFTKEEIEESIEKLGEDVRVRGEKLTLEQFAKLTNILMGEE